MIATGFEREEVAELLRRSGVRVVDVRVGNFDELFGSIREIGRAVNRLRQADHLVATMRAELEAIVAQYRDAAGTHRPRVFLEISDHPLTTAGGPSFPDDLIAKAGGLNVAHEIAQAYVNINPEKVVEWDPDIVVVARMGQPGQAAAQLSRRIGWAGISAVKRGRIVDNIHPDVLFRPGPRLMEGVKALAAELHRATKGSVTDATRSQRRQP